VLGDQRPDVLGQVGDLAAAGPGQRGAGQPGPAPGAPDRLMRGHPVRVIGHLQGRARLAVRPAGLAAALRTQRLRRRLAQPPPTTAAARSSAGSAPAGRTGPRSPRTAPPPAPAARSAAPDATSAAPRSRCPWPRSPAAAGRWPRAAPPPHPGQQGHRARTTDDHCRRSVINMTRRAGSQDHWQLRPTPGTTTYPVRITECRPRSDPAARITGHGF